MQHSERASTDSGTIAPNAAAVATARRFYKLLGRTPARAGGASIVMTRAAPDVWDANFALPDADADPASLLAAVDAHAAGDWRVIDTDALTAPAVETAVAVAGYEAAITLIEMLAIGLIHEAGLRPAIETVPVVGPEAWAELERLTRVDMEEGRRTGVVDADTATGLVADMRARTATCDYRVITLDGAAVGYGMTLRCPGDLALIENLFVLPDYRGRGIMSAFIASEVDRHIAAGCTGMFLDAHAHDTPRHLYAKLGFRPVGEWRRWVRNAAVA